MNQITCARIRSGLGPTPALAITKDAAPSKVRLQWSTAMPLCSLQTANALSAAGSGSFSAVANLPVIVDGQYTVTNAATRAAQYYRLVK